MPPAARADDTAAEMRFLPGRRDKTTRRSVVLADRAADWVIRIGGVGVIVAVFGIMAFLAEVVVPLFTGGRAIAERAVPRAVDGGETLIDLVDEYKTLMVALTRKGDVTALHLGTGRKIETPQFDFGGQAITAVAKPIGSAAVAFGFADGTVRFGTLSVAADVVTPDQLPANLTALDQQSRTDGRAVFTAISPDQVRRLTVALALDSPQAITDDGRPIVAMDYRVGGTVERPTRTLVTVDADGTARLSNAESKVNLLTGTVRTQISSTTLPELPRGIEVARVLVTDKADQVYVADAGGAVYRYDTRDFQSPALAERVDLLPGDVRLAAFRFLVGEATLVVAGSDGSVDNYFRLQVEGAGTTDGFKLVRSRRLEPHAAAVVASAVSDGTKTLVTADARGSIFVRHATSEQVLLRLQPKQPTGSYQALVLTPRNDGVVAVAIDGTVRIWDIDIPHPETTLKSIFGKIWYEGYPAPAYTWQSSSGTDSFEPKLSLVPLIFGTIKATFYSLLFAIPVALLSAIYTSEFVHPRVRAVVKPVMEMMASLPSVVLGFIAALVLAPIVESWIAAVLFAFVVLPTGLLVAAYAWQFLPAPLAIRLAGVPKLALMFAVLAACAGLAYAGAPLFERAFFAGDVKAWANGDVGGAGPFQFLLLFPASFIVANLAATRLLGPQVQDAMRRQPPMRAAATDLLRWLALLAAAVLLAGLGAAALGAAGFDARGGVVDTYVQRNTLVVGFAMGFAVIPIIYTIAEDALNAVPEHLRAASLACGATAWQTAISVILPTAFSGVFAAIMIGMGRAVGETMIVVMAAGNTPVMEWNIFSGLRALSANIAVELPEAVKDSTLYRMLFLAALTLFVMTFVINTIAEVIRLRFRRRAAQL